MISHTFRGAGTSVARVRWTARYASAIAGGNGRFCGLRGRFRACALPIPKEGLLASSRCDLIPELAKFLDGMIKLNLLSKGPSFGTTFGESVVVHLLGFCQQLRKILEIVTSMQYDV